MTASQITVNIDRVRERMEAAAARAGRSAQEITLIAVTKTVAPERIREAYEAGVRNFGESYVQEALNKVGRPPLDPSDVAWHFIGHLQSNKAREVVRRFALIHGVDALSLAREIGRRAERAGIVAPILMEIKLDPSDAKFGFAPEEALETAQAIVGLPGVRLQGLMGMAPFSEEPEQARPYFRRLHQLFLQLPDEARQTLSMGMTGDFEVAIEEGATHIRIGTAIFGRREP